ncbi:MAG: tetratricopeptide repeat protein, partial [Bradymonadaceae bacterium]
MDTLKEAAIQADPLVGAMLWKRVGRLLAVELEDVDAAIEAFERTLECIEGDEEALRSLDQLFESTGQVERLAENLRQQVLYGDPGATTDTLRRLANLEELILERPLEATQAYVEILEAEPDDVEAMEALERLYEAQDRWFDLADIMRRKVQTIFDPEVQCGTLLKLANIFEEQLHDLEAAIGVYREVLLNEPELSSALDALDRIFVQEGRGADLAEIIRAKLMSSSHGDDARANLELRLAEVLATELFAIEDALQLYRAVLAREPGRREAIQALERLAEDQSWLEEVTPDLQAHYRNEEAWDQLINLLNKRLENLFEPDEQARLWHEIAQVERARGDRSRAVTALAAAWKLDWEHEPYRD